jgi:uncharacterized protein (TIGR02452 family)
MTRQSRATLGKEAVEIVERGWYALDDGERVDIKPAVSACLDGTKLFTPDELASLVEKYRAEANSDSRRTEVAVTNESTLSAARRLVVEYGLTNTLCLNFASAKNPGGGFLGGSQAQEESLARASALYASLLKQPGYYEENRGCETPLYTNHMILSPAVPVFRNDEGDLLVEPFTVGMLASPAVNAGAVHANRPNDIPHVRPVMANRIASVLAVAAYAGYEHLVLGAWGCGVFRNDPEQIAELFGELLLNKGTFANRFASVTFAILDRSREATFIGPFERRFRTSSFDVNHIEGPNQ